MREKAFRLNKDVSHLFDMDFDASHIPTAGQDSIGFIMNGVDRTPLPPVIFFRANFNVIPTQTDFPVVDVTIPVISRRMLEVLLSVKNVKYRAVDVLMLDDTYLHNIFTEDIRIVSGIKKDESYLALQLMEYTDAFDYLNSVYRPLRSNPSMPGVISKLILKRPDGGFPPIFKISEKSSSLFISQAAKDAIEKNEIKGCLFEEIEVSN